VSRAALPASLKARILETTKREPAPTRQVTLVNTAVIVATSLATSMNVFLFAGGMRGDPRPRPLLLGTIFGWLSLAIASIWGALGRGGSMEGRPRRHLVALASAIPAGASAWMCLWAARYQAMAASLPAANGALCFLLAFGLSVPAFLGLAWVRRDSDVKHARATGAALGGAAGAWGGTFLDAHCPSLDLVHLAVGHVLPIAILALLGALFGRSLVRARPTTGSLSM
jgi:hypothetical protein